MILYKYFSSERVSFFKDQYVRFTQPSMFNDPFEFLPYEDFLDPDISPETNAQFLLPKEIYKTLQREGINIDDKKHMEYFNEQTLLFTSIWQRDLFGMYDKEGVFCLSEDWDNIVMWAHYASDHAGCCVGFDTSHSFFREAEILPLSQVRYTNMRPKFEVSDPDFLRSLILTKSEDWKYEKEWRMCREGEKSHQVNGVYLFRVPTEAIHSVILGVKATEEYKNTLLSLMREWTNQPQIYQAYIHPKEYRIIKFDYQLRGDSASSLKYHFNIDISKLGIDGEGSLGQ